METVIHYQAIVIGAGHAGCEAALALANMQIDTLLLTLNLDSIAFMACNPSIGGTAKGHLVKEIDALGGAMGRNADKTCMQIRMLNRGKGAAVQSLRAQTDKDKYHICMKELLENTSHLTIQQSEVCEILVQNGKVYGIRTTYKQEIHAEAIILATGVYLKSAVIAGDFQQPAGPNGFAPANRLTENLISLGFQVRRFKTGTPARIDGRSIDFSKCTVQEGDMDIYPFSFLTKSVPKKQHHCYLTYTNPTSHQIILDNLHRSPLYCGIIKGTGPRYCPSIEDKVVRFSDKDRHQIFLEPETEHSNEYYIQGMSTSLPHDVQEKLYHSIAGLENCKIMRYAYSIEYDCIDSLDLYPTLEFKKIEGIYVAGQVNGTSGYEEAAAQGLIAGINAGLKIKGLPPFILQRDEAYIGVLIDDLVTKGTNEPYRMMTSRAEHRIYLRQDNADLRLTEKGYAIGLVDKKRYTLYKKRKKNIENILQILQTKLLPKEVTAFLAKYNYPTPSNALTYADLLRRGIPIADICTSFSILQNFKNEDIETATIQIIYEGYLKKGLEQIEKAKKLEDRKLPKNFNYHTLEGLRLEARQKLSQIQPENLGQASRISGVSPADIAVLMVYLSMQKQ